jgi:hypothetical protein
MLLNTAVLIDDRGIQIDTDPRPPVRALERVHDRRFADQKCWHSVAICIRQPKACVKITNELGDTHC